jgi:hypothetical protein
VSIECSIHDYEGAPDEPCPECQWETLRAQLTECRAVLKEVEWSHDNACPVCALYEDSVDGLGRGPGHDPDCRLAKCLSE